MIGKQPSILARRNSHDNLAFELTQRLQARMERRCFARQTADHSVLVVLDRGMDLETVLRHDLALQVSG